MRSSSRAAAVVELFVRAVVAERKAREALGGDTTSLPPEVFDPPGSARASRLPPINVWWSDPDGIVH